MNRDTYIAILDQRDITGRNKAGFWFSNQTRRLTPEQAQPLLEQGKIAPFKVQPKRMVELHDADGSIQILTWGDYLKRLYANRPKLSQVSADKEE